MLETGTQLFDGDELAELFCPVAGESRIALAVSGGADSLGLMLLTYAWKNQFGKGQGPEIIVYCVDHRLRAESGQECALVLSVAAQLGLAARVLPWEGEKPETGVQAAAREARYRLMGAAMQEDGASVLLTGHHALDQSETVLMRLAHSSGIGGLAGMRAFSEVGGVRVFRPLLGVLPHMLAQVVSRVGIAWVEDPSNGDETYERVRWRNRLSTFEGLGLTSQVLGRFGCRMARAEDALALIGEKAFLEVVSCDQFGVFSVMLATLLALPEEIGLRVLSRMLLCVSGGRGAGELGQLEILYRRLADGAFNGISLAGCCVSKARGKLFVYREVSRIAERDVVLDPGDELVWDRRFVIANSGVEPALISAGLDISRARAEEFAGGGIESPMAGVAAAPRLASTSGMLLGMGELCRTDQVSCRIAMGPQDCPAGQGWGETG